MSGTKWFDGIDLTGRAKYKALADHLSNAIETGALPVGERLPPVRQLAWEIGVTPGTVARAYSQLTDAGQLEAVVGRGTFVAPKRPVVAEEDWLRAHPQDDGVINLFSPRLPDMGQVSAIRAALRQVADGPIADLVEYPSREGFQPAREAAVKWLSDMPLGSVGHKDVVLCHGGQNAISLVLQAALREQKPTIMVEDLSYPGFRRAAEILRIEVVGVPSDAQGLIPEEIERVAQRSGARLICTSPEVHNPTGLHTPLERREAIVAACRRAGGVQILEDDCYRIGPARAQSYRALWPEGAWYVSSISKTITPALRIGFAVAAEGRYSDLRRAAEYGFFGLARPLAEVARIVLSDPETQRISAAVRDRIAEYIQIAVNMLGGFELKWRDDVPFLWLDLPRGWRASEFTLAAERAGIQIRSAEDFTLREGRAPHSVRICVNGQISLERFEAAMTVLREMLNNPPEQMTV
ncbi:PLP-dependent aminotransferase family protein [Aliiruegeria lutimaris]|uniref:Transcriptional regulator, GntR family n=1 Tax=Aliiruegeria lutimaris TaxID=571298 RepID=A0A1G8Z8V1_9RHOB|nr:PLP-dependent aminotransferase family protein [Aliiruegeria lutimaris]SDK11413.1 transcriptional regulator, GntR family [Aliiruegeria lutimaris]